MSRGEFCRVLPDIETNGLLPVTVDPPFCMDRIHAMAVTCLDSRKKRSYVADDLLPLRRADVAALEEYGHTDIRPLSEGVGLVNDAAYITGHNIIDFDLEALRLIYPNFAPKARIVDTLVMARMVFADVKERDFRMVEKGTLEGRYIGQQGLEAWGQRLGLAKGDYAKERKQALKDLHREQGLPPPTEAEIHAHVWGRWSPAMHDYMCLDVDVNEILWDKIEAEGWSPQAVALEHHIHALMVQQERNGFLFDVEKAEHLADVLRAEYGRLAEAATDAIGKWYSPEKVVKDRFDPEMGETGERRVWGVNAVPKSSANRIKSIRRHAAEGTYTNILPSLVAGCPRTPVKLKEFNPNSRPQIVDRLQTLYGWEPADFTEKGQARVDDEILRGLADKIPLAETLAEVFYQKKRLGQVADGQNGWLKLVRRDGRIHGRVNVGGTVSGRGTHSSPNVSQVPGVTALEFKDYEKGLDFIAEMEPQRDFWGRSLIVDAQWKEAKGEWVIYTRGRSGGYGWDCRELFTVPDGYSLMGCDLSGVEFRCLANLTFPFDDGELVDIVLNGDIHQKNADLAGISRNIAKRLLYACMYGGGDAKLGSIVEPFAAESRQRMVGRALREKLMRAMPSLARAIKEIHREMRRNRGRIRGLDGRWLYARSKHSALNLRLQSDGALIAKKWCLLVDDAYYDAGWDHAVDAEYAFCSWSHDEIQVAVQQQLAERAARIAEAMAPKAGDYFNFNCPIAAEAKIGAHWAETH